MKYEIGSFRLDSNAGVLMYEGRSTALGPRAVAVLSALVARANEFVPKASLLEVAWPDAVVEEGNLPVQITAIRRALALGGGDAWIETLPRRGYRFVGPVKELDRWQPRPTDSRSNLPAPLTSFVGRERELVDIKRLLANRRLITILGSGGIGKTRLALQAASEVFDAYRDGAWMAELGSIRDPALVATTVCQTLGVTERAGKAATDSLIIHLRTRQILVILDNCEHLVNACAQFADAVLRGAREVTIIATSREPLRIAGEQSYLLQSLSLPETDSQHAVRDSEAAQLFLDRVEQHLPDFVLTPERGPAVAGICSHLDGIPLALELAAARTRSLSIEQINGRLSDRFRLLTDGSRTVLPRQQTLRATVDWSYDLLSEDERATFRRLSVFPGSFSVEAASALAYGGHVHGDAVSDILAQLVSRSLILADTLSSGTRYRLLETTRAYAMEKLTEAGEADQIRDRHTDYFHALFGRAFEEWMRIPDAEWRAIYLSELDNVRAALDRCYDRNGDSATAVALTAASGALWLESALQGEGRRRFQSALERSDTRASPMALARLWFWMGYMQAGVPMEAIDSYERAVHYYRETEDHLGQGLAFIKMGAELAYVGEFQRSEVALRDSLSLLSRSAPAKITAEYFVILGHLNYLRGDVDSAGPCYERAASQSREAGAERVAISVLSSLADLKWLSRDLDGALSAVREAIELARPRGIARGIALTNLAGMLVECGKLDEALTAARGGLPLRAEAGHAWACLDHLGLRAVLAGKAERAARIAGYADAVHAVKQPTRQPNEARARERLHALLRDKLSATNLERLLAEGAKLSEDEACRLALED